MSKKIRQPPGLPLRPVQPKQRGLLARVKRAFAHGLAVLLPSLLTVIILLWAYSLLDKYANVWLQYLLSWFSGWDIETTKEVWTRHNLGWLGILVNLVVVFLVGLAVANIFGRAIWRIVERVLLRIPVIKQIYPYVKPVTGYTIQLPRQDVIELDLTVDQALRYTITGGGVNPRALGAQEAYEPPEQAGETPAG